MATLFTLVGAEGVSEMQLPNEQLPGIREATPDELKAFQAGLAEAGVVFGNFSVDGTGRPYWLIAVEDIAPAQARERAARYKRIGGLFP